MLLDATAIPTDRGGVGRYVDELLPELVAAGVDLVVVCQPRDVDGYARILSPERVLAAPDWVARRPLRLAWEQLGLPRLVRRLGAGVLHCPHYTMPLAAGVPVVVTLHDATFFTHPELHSAVKRRFFRAWTRISLRRARRCIVPSRATRDELVRVAGARVDRVDVAHHGVDRTTFHVPDAGEVAAVRSDLDLGERPYVAFLGTLEPRKNVPALIRGWTTACRGRPEPPALVLAGGPGWDPDVDVAAAEVPPELHLVRPGYLPLEHLAAFLGGAEVVAYPSLGEGFGLPVLEAMACGAPVLTTRLLSLPEVAGEAAAYTGTGAAEIAADLAGLLDDPRRRAELRVAARQRAEGFTWAACARAHAESYARAARPTT